MDLLETARLRIRPFTVEDLEAAHRLLDVELRWSGPGFTLDQRRERLGFYTALARWEDTGRLYGYRAVTLKPTGDLIGICGFIPCLWQARHRALLSPADGASSALELDVGYALGSAHRGRGYATEAPRALIDHAFGALGVRRLVAGTGRDNAGSIGLLKRVGCARSRARTTASRRSSGSSRTRPSRNDPPGRSDGRPAARRRRGAGTPRPVRARRCPSRPGGQGAGGDRGGRTLESAAMDPATVAERRAELYRLLGELPPRDRPISARLVDREEREGYTLERLVLDLNGLEPVPAYFTRPKDTGGRVPVVLYNHAHGGDYVLGKDELLDGRAALQRPPYAEALAGRGYAALAIDAWLFGERRGRTESELFKLMLWRGQVLWGMMVYDSLRAIDYLATRRDVDPDRIATLGLSMGSTMAWWVAALDERVRVCVDLCCLTDFEALIETRHLDGHGIYYYVPGLLKRFTTARINALIAPRPHLSLAGTLDRLTPPAGLDRVDAELRRVYAEAGAPEAWRLVRYETGHFETAAGRAEVLAFLERHLATPHPTPARRRALRRGPNAPRA